MFKIILERTGGLFVRLSIDATYESIIRCRAWEIKMIQYLK